MTLELLKKLPNCKLVSTISQTEDEDGWLKVRTRGIGGSDIGAICGVSPFSSARQIYMNKVGQYEESTKPNKAAIERMHFGHMLEGVIADEYQLRTGRKLVNVEATFCHKDYPWALANIDRLIVDDEGNPIGVLECKSTSEYNNEAWENGDIPVSYIYQLNWYLWILDMQWGAFSCLVGGNKYYEFTLFRDDELINNVILPAAKKFWFENVLMLKEPELQSVDTDLINGIFSEVKKGSEVGFDDDVTNELAAIAVECKAKIKELEKLLDETQNRLKDRLRENEIGYTKDYIIKWSPRSQLRVDTAKLKTLFPEVYLAVQHKVDFRVMTIKGGRDE